MARPTTSAAPPSSPPSATPPCTSWCPPCNQLKATLFNRQDFAAQSKHVVAVFVDGDRPRHVVRVDDVPPAPTARDLAGVATLVDGIVDGPRSCAFLYARPGGAERSAGDLAWARGLAEIGLEGHRVWPVHLANDVELRVAAPDDLAAAG